MKITIAGLPGAGKTSLLYNLANFYGTQPISIGDLRGDFAWKEYQEGIDELNKRRETHPEVDTRFDEYQREYKATNDLFTIEGRVSYIFAPKDCINIFLVSDRLVRAERIFKKQRKDEKQCNSLREVLEMLDQRIASDIETYQKLYETNCYDASNFDLTINTTFQTEKEVLDRTLNRIKLHEILLEKYNLIP